LFVCFRIARAEVEEIARLVGEELSVVLPGFIHTITGGYELVIENLSICSVFEGIDVESPKAMTSTSCFRTRRVERGKKQWQH